MIVGRQISGKENLYAAWATMGAVPNRNDPYGTLRL
jgi:hypothetical protein